MADVKKIINDVRIYVNCKNIRALASFLGLKDSTIYSWINRGSIGSPEIILDKCKGVRLEFLLTGEGPMLENEAEMTIPALKSDGTASSSPPEPPNVGPAHLDRIKPIMVPLISWVQAGGWSEVSDPFQPGDAERWFSTTATSHPNAFVLRVSGDSMEPKFMDGDFVVVDPGRPYGTGSYVIVKNGDNEATFKQLVLDGSSVYLKPLNKRYPIKDVTGTNLKIVGVVVQRITDI